MMLARRVLFLLLTLSTYVHAQPATQIAAGFNSIPLDTLVRIIEQQTEYRFYYDRALTDSLVVNVSTQEKSVTALLEEIFADTDFFFAVDPDNRIYITRGRPVYDQLPPGFFGETSTRSQRPSFDFSQYEKKEKERMLVEHQVHMVGRNMGSNQGMATIAGSIRDANTGEPVIGASVYVENPVIGITTDQFGYYAVTLPKGRHALKVQSVGMKSTVRQIMLYGNGRLDIELDEDITPLKEVVVEADGDAHVLGMQMGTEKLDIKTMKQIPLALGETDIMKVMLTLPGVQSAGEGTVGLNVRGGAANQNLILLNDAVVYNPSHLFGFFSTFNPDVLKNVELYKSAIQAEYGGRISSVLDVHTREGNTKKFSGSGGISPITGRLSLEGPIIRDKTSFIIGARSTYSGWLLRELDDKELKNSTASFYDITANISHLANENNNIYVSAYASKDRFRLNNTTAYSYSDNNASLKWKHLFNNKLYGVLTGGFSSYQYAVENDEIPAEAFKMEFTILQIHAKADFSYFPNSRHTINAGVSTTRYALSPGTRNPAGDESIVSTDVLQDEQGLESAVYIGENFEVSRKLSLYFGLRYSVYQYLGPREVYQYAAGAPLQPGNITDTLRYASGKSIASYHGAEPRLSIRYMVSENTSVKVSYNRMRQYIQMLSNTVSINPTDIWKLSDAHIKPQVGDQISLGFYRYLKGNTIETSVEAYYKETQHLTDYKDGAILLMNHHLETDLADAVGKAYGLELMIKKNSGKLNGWISYTFSRTLIQTNGDFADETVNGGSYYPAHYDKPHAMNFIGNYKFSRRFNFSLNAIYSSGRPITLPVAKYEVDGVLRVFYSDRNQHRIPHYFRTDISINVEGNHKVKKLAHSSWTFAVYNLLGRANPYSVYFVSENGGIAGYKLSIFARPIPTITYNFKF